MTKDIFAKVGVSTFTHVGRHARTIRTLVRLPNEAPNTILNLGSGVLEPFLIAEHVLSYYGRSSASIRAIDGEKQFVNMIDKLKRGGSVPIESLARIAVDRTLSGNPIMNDNFQSRLGIGIRDYEESGLTIDRLIDVKSNAFRVHKDSGALVEATCAMVDDDLISQFPSDSVDLIYAGAIFINILKTQKEQNLLKLLYELQRVLHTDGYFALGTSPSFLYGKSVEINLLKTVGFIKHCIIAENLIFETNKGLFGDFAIICMKNPNQPANRDELQRIASIVTDHPALSALTVIRKPMSYSQLIQHFHSQENLLCICAIVTEADRFEAWFLRLDELVTHPAFKERVLLNLYRK